MSVFLRLLGLGLRIAEAVSGKQFSPLPPFISSKPESESVPGLPAKDAQRQLDFAKNAGPGHPPPTKKEPSS